MRGARPADCRVPPVLLLDGGQRAALAVVRSLGRQGVGVIVADETPASLAGVSRFCRKSAAVGSPRTSASDFAGRVLRLADGEGCRIVFAVTDASITALHAAVPDCSGRLAGPSPAAYASASDKISASNLARRVGLFVPEGIICQDADALVAAVRCMGYPLVIKPALSQFILEGRVVSTGVSIVRDAPALGRALDQPWVGQLPCLVQRFVPGRGAAVFALYGPDGVVAWFAHRRRREKPPTGGVSVLCESVAPDPQLQDAAGRLLEALSWFGPAMVEFRVDPHGKPWFMEVNGRFWGSLELAIDCGVDFPWLLYQLCLGREAESATKYRIGRRLRWELGDFDHLLLQLRGMGTASSAAAKLRALVAFLNPFAGWPEVFRLGDPKPFLHELRAWIAAARR